jgi:hypothetical protein
MSKPCISCGMPMQDDANHPGRDSAREYCAHCARADGSLKSFDEMLASMSHWLVQSQGFDPGRAKAVARGLLRKQPAWRRS